MPLTADITRRHDATCQSRERCRRWLERETGSSHAASLREPGGYCLSYVHPGPPQSTIPVPDGIAPEQHTLYRTAYLRGWLEGYQLGAEDQQGEDDG